MFSRCNGVVVVNNSHYCLGANFSADSSRSRSNVFLGSSITLPSRSRTTLGPLALRADDVCGSPKPEHCRQPGGCKGAAESRERRLCWCLAHGPEHREYSGRMVRCSVDADVVAPPG